MTPPLAVPGVGIACSAQPGAGVTPRAAPAVRRRSTVSSPFISRLLSLEEEDQPIVVDEAAAPAPRALCPQPDDGPPPEERDRERLRRAGNEIARVESAAADADPDGARLDVRRDHEDDRRR